MKHPTDFNESNILLYAMEPETEILAVPIIAQMSSSELEKLREAAYLIISWCDAVIYTSRLESKQSGEGA